MRPTFSAQSRELAEAAVTAAAGSPDQRGLRHALETALETACRELRLTWSAYRLERTPWRSENWAARFAPAIHGAIVIEYEPPGSFREGYEAAAVATAQQRAVEYCESVGEQEGRPFTGYTVVVWDGAHLSFGRFDGCTFTWEPVAAFDPEVAERLLRHLSCDGVPLVHPNLLAQLVGPDSELGTRFLPKLYDAVRASTKDTARTGRTLPLFGEWQRLFGQVGGDRSRELRKPLAEQGRHHDRDYQNDPGAYLFTLNTYIALTAKLVAAMALPNTSRNVASTEHSIDQRIRDLESGRPFTDAGIANMLNGDLFAWYRHDPNWRTYAAEVESLISILRTISFDVRRKTPGSTRDLFKGLYMEFVPRALRHALGEYYTPDWLAAHALDQIEWRADQGLGDPTAGSGTFLLEALKRRLTATPHASADELLDGLWGMDLNPLAVLTARASLVVYLADRLDPDRPLRLPMYLADAINPATATANVYEHRLQTELGERTFRIPATLVERADFYRLLARARELVESEHTAETTEKSLAEDFELGHLDLQERTALRETLETLTEMCHHGWDGVWCEVLADRFAAGTIRPAPVVAGNPPWVKWSDLPPNYARLIRQRCLDLGMFSPDRWVGGIESDISTVITYEALDRYLAHGGTLAFFITGTVFSNASSQGFRRWRLEGSGTDIQVRFVEDYGAIAPFDGVHNHATMLVLTKGKRTTYPVGYRVWSTPTERDQRSAQRTFTGAAAFRSAASSVELEARPVPGTDAGPWLKGTRAQQEVWNDLFGAQDPAYQARKGVTTDANGIYFVRAEAGPSEGLVTVQNAPSNGRRALPAIRRSIETEHVFPLLRGKGVRAFEATPDPVHRLVVPQRGMHGDPQLPVSAPRTHQWLRHFESILESRSSYRRFQQRQGAPYWSLWSTGAYTFSPFKVAWREMPSGRFAAGYVGSTDDPVLGTKIVIPDHKLYFVSCESEEEAAYLTGLLNAPVIADAVSGYAAQLSLGASVVEYLLIRLFDPADPNHRALASLAKTITAAGGSPAPQQQRELNRLAARIQGLPPGTFTDG